jgi:hypothetical protein
MVLEAMERAAHMSMTIWKVALRPLNVQRVKMPRGAKILSAHAQGNVPTIWFLCDADEPIEEREIAIVATGSAAPYPAEAHFIGTIQFDGGGVVVHVFEKPQ